MQPSGIDCSGCSHSQLLPRSRYLLARPSRSPRSCAARSRSIWSGYVVRITRAASGLPAGIAARSNLSQVAGMAAHPAQLPVDALKRMVATMAQETVHARTVIEKLRFELIRLKRGRFGASSEKLDTRTEQHELAIVRDERHAAAG